MYYISVNIKTQVSEIKDLFVYFWNMQKEFFSSQQKTWFLHRENTDQVQCLTTYKMSHLVATDSLLGKMCKWLQICGEPHERHILK